MASEQDIALFKLHLAGVEEVWEDSQISTNIDALGSVSKAVRAFWSEKVNSSYRYMDISESSSSRSLSQIYRNAVEQLSRWDKIVSDEDAKQEQETVGSIRFGDIRR
jgi:hypothetical protein